MPGGFPVSTLTPDEVAEDLRLPNAESAIRLMRAGVIPAFRVGRYWRVDAAQLEAWKAERSAAPTPNPHGLAPRTGRKGRAS